MADFTTFTAGSPMGTSVTPATPVATDSASGVLDSLGTLARGAFSAFEDAAKLEAAKQKKAEELAGAKVLARFRTEQLKLIDAYEQGTIKQGEARSRMREKLNEFQSNNVLLGEDLMKTHQNIMSTAGLGKVVDEGTEEDRERNRLRQSAQDAGWLQDAPDEEEAVANFLRFQAAKDKLANSQAELNYENSKLERTGKITSNESAAIALTEKKIQLSQQAAVAELADAFAPNVRDKTVGIVSKFNNGELDVNGALAEINAIRQTIMSTVTGAGRKAGSDYLTTVVNPMLETLDAAKAFVKGEETLTAATNQFENNILRQKILLTSDPKNAGVVAISQLFRNIDTLRAPEVDSTVTNMFGLLLDDQKDNFNPYTKDTKAAKTALEIIKDNISKANTGKANDAAYKEMDAAVTDILTGVTAYKGALTENSQLKNVQDFLADPVVAQYINTRGLPEGTVTSAKETFQELYEMRVLPAIQKELTNASVVSGFKSTGKGFTGGEVTGTPATEAVQMKFSGSSVFFEGTTGAAKLKAKDLNTKLAPVMNKTIKITAHLNGGTDYKGAYERLFGEMIKEEQKGAEGNP